MDLGEATSRLRALLDEAIGSMKASGVLLSGGLDTSIIALIAKRHVPRLRAFTVTLKGVDDDLTYAETVAWGKWLLRKAFEDYLPPEVIWRRKTPIDVGTGTIRALGLK
jgi:hypothetical protein